MSQQEYSPSDSIPKGPISSSSMNSDNDDDIELIPIKNAETTTETTTIPDNYEPCQHHHTPMSDNVNDMFPTTTTYETDQISNITRTISSFYKEHCSYLPAMLGWFLFSGLLSLYNKYVFGDEYLAFPCPLLMTSAQFAIQFVFSMALTKLFPVTLGGDQVDAMCWNTFLTIAVPCGAVTSFDIGLSNLALVRISITFYTMVKSCSPIFVVISAYLLGIETLTWPLILTVLIISVGELLAVFGEIDFDAVGFVLVLSASVLSGMRWTLVQLKLQSIEPPLKSAVATMRILSPFMFLCMLVMSLLQEKPLEILSGKFFASKMDILETFAFGFIGAMLAIIMILCEFFLVMKSSAIVLMIGGVLKEMTTIMIGVFIMEDKLNFINSLGCVVVFSGVLFYKGSLYLKKIDDTYEEVSVHSADSESSTEPLISNNNMDKNIGGDSIHDSLDQDKENSPRIPKSLPVD